MINKKVININRDIVGTPEQLKYDKHLQSLNWIALLDSEPQLAIKVTLENLIATYGTDAVKTVSQFVISDAEKEAA